MRTYHFQSSAIYLKLIIIIHHRTYIEIFSSRLHRSAMILIQNPDPENHKKQEEKSKKKVGTAEHMNQHKNAWQALARNRLIGQRYTTAVAERKRNYFSS